MSLAAYRFRLRVAMTGGMGKPRGMIRLLLILACLLLPTLPAQAQWPKWPAVTAHKAPNEQPYPTGIDLGFPAGAPIAFTRPATLIRADKPQGKTAQGKQLGWPSLVAELAMQDGPLTVRLVGASASLRPGEKQQAGQPLALAADPTPIWPGLPGHVTLEVYRDGKRLDPTPWAIRLLPQGLPVQLTLPADAANAWPQWKLRGEAYASARKDAKAAVSQLRGAMRYPAFKASNLDLAEDLALAAAAAGDKLTQAAALRRSIRLAQAEMAYAEGGLPEIILGPVSAARHPAALQAILNRNEAALTALGPVTDNGQDDGGDSSAD